MMLAVHEGVNFSRIYFTYILEKQFKLLTGV